MFVLVGKGGGDADLGHLVVLHVQDLLHQVVRLADQLHVPVLNAVVDHLHKVSRSLVAHLTAAETHRGPVNKRGKNNHFQLEW